MFTSSIPRDQSPFWDILFTFDTSCPSYNCHLEFSYLVNLPIWTVTGSFYVATCYRDRPVPENNLYRLVTCLKITKHFLEECCLLISSLIFFLLPFCFLPSILWISYQYYEGYMKNLAFLWEYYLCCLSLKAQWKKRFYNFMQSFRQS